MIDPAHLTDAELAAWYGSGLHAPKAQRLIEEVRRLRFRLAETEQLAEDWEERARALRARLAEVEAERDEWRSRAEMVWRQRDAADRRAEAAEELDVAEEVWCGECQAWRPAREAGDRG